MWRKLQLIQGLTPRVAFSLTPLIFLAATTQEVLQDLWKRRHDGSCGLCQHLERLCRRSASETKTKCQVNVRKACVKKTLKHVTFNWNHKQESLLWQQPCRSSWGAVGVFPLSNVRDDTVLRPTVDKRGKGLSLGTKIFRNCTFILVKKK